MSNTKHQWPPALRQCFVAGLRFDQALQYPVRVGATRRWRNLPLKLNPQEQALYPHEPGLRLGLMQCMAVTAQWPWPLVQEAIQPFMAQPLQTIRSTAHCAEHAWHLHVDLHSATDMRAQRKDAWRLWQIRLGRLALQATETGGMCLLGIKGGDGMRWLTVVGVQYLAVYHAVQALLLLDTCGSEPWVCAHNAQLQLLTGPQGLCRYLTGEVFEGAATQLIIVRPSSKHATDTIKP